MKLHHLILTIVFLFSSQVFAGWGIAGGMNLNTGNNSNPAPLNINLEPGLGFMFGGFYSYHFSDDLWLRGMGQARTFRVRKREAGSNFQVYSLQFATPIVLQHRIYEWFGYFIGPDFAFNINNEATLNDVETNLKFNSVVVSAMAGLSFRLTKKLSVEVYYNQGLTDIAENIRGQSFGFQFVTSLGRKR